MRQLSVGEAEQRAKEFIYQEDYDSLYEIVEQVLKQEELLGSPDDFHNFSVNFSRKDDYKMACRILDRGLSLYPYSVDLLADYLQSGVNCNKIDECKQYYKVLNTIKKYKWTWRGFSFGVDYLLYCIEAFPVSDYESEKLRKEAITLSEEYSKYFPYREDTYIVKSSIYHFFKEYENEQAVLIDAFNILDICPKCSLKLADYAFERGEFENALVFLEKGMVGAVQTQETVNTGYMYLLSGLCKTAIFYKNANYSDKEKVSEIYRDFQVSNKTNSNATYRRTIERHIDILESKTGILYEDVTNA